MPCGRTCSCSPPDRAGRRTSRWTARSPTRSGAGSGCSGSASACRASCSTSAAGCACSTPRCMGNPPPSSWSVAEAPCWPACRAASVSGATTRCMPRPAPGRSGIGRRLGGRRCPAATLMTTPNGAAVLTGLGTCLPWRVVTNDELAGRLDTSDDWIRSRTGIGRRHLIEPGMTTGDLATRAGELALQSADCAGVDAVVLATTTPDRLCPATAPEVAARLGLTGVAAYDLHAVCTGFIYGLANCAGLIATGAAARVLLVGAETYSTIIDPADRTTAVIFADGGARVGLPLVAAQSGTPRPRTPAAHGSVAGQGLPRRPPALPDPLQRRGRVLRLLLHPVGDRLRGRTVASSPHHYLGRGRHDPHLGGVCQPCAPVGLPPHGGCRHARLRPGIFLHAYPRRRGAQPRRGKLEHPTAGPRGSWPWPAARAAALGGPGRDPQRRGGRGRRPAHHGADNRRRHRRRRHRPALPDPVARGDRDGHRRPAGHRHVVQPALQPDRLRAVTRDHHAPAETEDAG